MIFTLKKIRANNYDYGPETQIKICKKFQALIILKFKASILQNFWLSKLFATNQISRIRDN